MTDLDTILRRSAHDHLATEAARLDVDAELVAFRAIAADEDTATVTALTSDDRVASTSAGIHRIEPAPSREGSRRWLAVAAAVTLVAGLGVALLASGRTSDDPVPPLDTAPTSEIDESAPTTSSIPSTPGPVDSLAVADPATVEAGGTVTIAPDDVVTRNCDDAVYVQELGDGGAALIGIITPSGGSRFVSGSEPEMDTCDGDTTADALTLVIPTSFEAGDYRLCIAGLEQRAGCAAVSVFVGTTTTAVEPPASTAPPATGEENAGPLVSPVPYFGRTDDPNDPARPLTIVRIDPDGTVLGELDDAEYGPDVLSPVAVAPGAWIGVDRDGRPEGGRCTYNRLGLGSDTEDPGFELGDLGDVLGIAGSGTGYVVVSRDVCPDGTRWGDPGTYHEVVRYHLTDPSDPPVQIARVDADPDAIVFDDGGNFVVAPGELYPVSVDPTGRWVGVREWHTIEDLRHHVYDATLRTGDAGWGEPVEFASTCAAPGHIAAVPRFEDVPALGGQVAVVARQCPVDSEQIAVEAIRLSDEEVVWSLAVDDVSLNGYSGGVDTLSTTVVDGELWAMVSGAAFEGPLRTALLHGDDQAEITRPEIGVLAFDLDDLVGDNEALTAFGG